MVALAEMLTKFSVGARDADSSPIIAINSQEKNKSVPTNISRRILVDRPITSIK